MAIIVDPISIEPMRRADVETVAEIERKCYPTPWHENAYYTEISNRSAIYFVARLEGSVVGYAGMWLIMDEAHITTVAVDPVHRGRKIGDRLMNALMEEAVLHGAARATLEVREHNVVAQNLYRKYGFRDAAIRKNYYTDNQENAIIMWADGLRTDEYRERLRDLKGDLYRAYHERLRY